MVCLPNPPLPQYRRSCPPRLNFTRPLSYVESRSEKALAKT